MTPERYQQIKNIYQAAMELDPGRRPAFLDEACVDNPSLRRDVEGLLAYEARQVSFMETPAVAADANSLIEDSIPFLVGQSIGPYRILRPMGDGGMGEVYLAERADQAYEKKVAIKFIKRGMDTGAVLQHFYKERQILANLDHPNIAKLLDGGTTADGRSYFVMDYIQGQPIDAYCDTHQLRIEDRLQLFRTVCSAVQYAHGHHVVHRDVKPSNILVTEEGVPKLLDFGIAKMVDPQHSRGTTSTKLRPMTPEYASPEQVRGGPITTSSDVYSLGVVLYELLTGHGPYQLESHTPQEIERAIGEEEPEKPSRAIRRIGQSDGADDTAKKPRTPESVSVARRSQPDALQRKLTGDLDNIVLMALRKEPDRRYASVEQFSEDIARHLEGRPVIARPGTLAYRGAKFITRNKTGMIAAACLAGAVLAVIGIEELYRLPRRAPALGRTPEAIAARPKAIDSIAVLPLENLSRDPEQLYLADGMTDALTTDLAKIGALRVISRASVTRYKGKPLPEIGRELNVDAVIEGSMQRIGDRVQIAVQLIHAASKRHLWAERYERDIHDILILQGEVAGAIASQIKIRVTPQEQARLAHARPVAPEALEAYLQGRYFESRYTEEGLQNSIQYFEKATEIDPTYALAYSELAEVYILLGSGSYSLFTPKEASPKARAAVMKALELDNTLAEAHTELGKFEMFFDWDFVAAEKELKRAIELNPGYSTGHHFYAFYLVAMGRGAEAITEIKRAQEIDPVSAWRRNGAGRYFYYLRQYDQALQELRSALEVDPNFHWAHRHLGWTYAQKGMYDEAIAELRKAHVPGAGPIIIADLGYTYALAGRGAEATKVLEELQALSKRSYVSPYHFAVVYVGLGQKEQALGWLEKAYEERTSWPVFLKVEPKFDPLRADPRFTDLLRRIGLPP